MASHIMDERALLVDMGKAIFSTMGGLAARDFFQMELGVKMAVISENDNKAERIKEKLDILEGLQKRKRVFEEKENTLLGVFDEKIALYRESLDAQKKAKRKFFLLFFLRPFI